MTEAEVEVPGTVATTRRSKEGSSPQVWGAVQPCPHLDFGFLLFLLFLTPPHSVMLCFSNPEKQCTPHRPYEENKTIAPAGGTEGEVGLVGGGHTGGHSAIWSAGSPLLWERLPWGYSCSEWIADPEKGVEFAPLQTRTCCPLHHQDGSCSLVSPPGS